MMKLSALTLSLAMAGMVHTTAVQAAVDEQTSVIYDRFGKFERELDENGNPIQAKIGIVVIGERPYAEGRKFRNKAKRAFVSENKVFCRKQCDQGEQKKPV